MRLEQYTDRQSRIDKAFHPGATCCQVQCEVCHRTYFVTSPGHGDYEPGEVEKLRCAANDLPDRYIEVPDFSSVSYVTLPIGPHAGKTAVIGCHCDPTAPLAEFIESYAGALTEYLRRYWQARRQTAARALEEADKRLAALPAAAEGSDAQDS